MAKQITTYSVSSGSSGVRWDVSISDTNNQSISVTGDSFTVNYPTVMVTRATNVGTKKLAHVELTAILKNASGSDLWSLPMWSPREYTKYTWTSIFTQGTANQIYRRSDVTDASKTYQTSSFFNTTNPTSRGVTLTWTLQLLANGLASTNSSSNPTALDRAPTTAKSTTWAVAVSLNAPPTFTSTNVLFNESYHVAGHTRASVTISSLSAKYGGTIKSVVFKIGNQTTSGTGNGTLSIDCSTAGTFTPTVTVTDSRGQVTTKSLSAITINSHADPTFTASNVSFNESYHVAGHTTASTTISSISAKDGSAISSVKFTIGNQSVTGTGNGTLSIACNKAGTYTPTVIVTDTWGASVAKTLANITINSHTAPTFTATDVTFNESYHVAGHTTASTQISSLSLKNGTTLSSMVFKIGSQTVSGTGNGPLSINCDTTGPFTPNVTVTDSWGATTSKDLSSITINPHTAPTLQSTQVSFVDSDYAGYGKAKVTISQATTYEGASIATNGITLRINTQTASISNNGDIITPILNTSGKFTPTVTITDNWGGTKTYSLNEVTIKQYAVPSIGKDIEVERVDENGDESDEGPNAVITVPLTYTYQVEQLQMPDIVATTLEDEELLGLNISWYTSRDLTTPISDWSTIPNNTTVYAFITDSDSDYSNTPFDTQQSYNITVTPNDTRTSGIPSNITLPAAYYTVDFLAGGHGIAFGKPAIEEKFDCGMDANFDGSVTMSEEGVYYKGTNNTTQMIRFLDNTTDEWGNGMVIGGGASEVGNAGGLVIIGAGESPNYIQESLYDEGYAAGSELLALSSDGDINIYTNAWNGYTTAKKSILSSDGYFKPALGIASVNSIYAEVYADITIDEIKAQNSSLTSSSSDSDWMNATLRAICVKYPNRGSVVFKGKISPNSNAWFEVFIYNTSITSNNLPQYSFGNLYKYPQRQLSFGTVNYVFSIRSVAGQSDIAECTRASGWTDYNSGSGPVVYRCGQVCTFQWVTKSTSSVQLTDSLKTVCTIPAGFRPLRQYHAVCQGSGTSFFYMVIDTGGSVLIGRLRDVANTNSQWSTATTSWWLPMSATYITTNV